MKRALITGITGQDGSYLAELLLEKGYEVHGLLRGSASHGTSNIDQLVRDERIHERTLFLHNGDLADSTAIQSLVRDLAPDEVYNLAAQSHVRLSFDIPEHTLNVNGAGTIRLLDAIVKHSPKTRYYQASSSELFGNARSCPQSETTPFAPGNPYACSKAYSFWLVSNYRQAYGVHASNGIAYNHESPRRGEAFVTRKITRTLARIVGGKQEFLLLGNLDVSRDWGFARDYVEAMWLMLQAPEPDDYVIATGELHSIREFLAEAFGIVGLDWRAHVKTDRKFFRPTEVNNLVGDATKARERLGWRPKTRFPELVRLMVEEDLRLEGLDPARIVAMKEAA
ncbi:MAG: GDP-mannose 4,6-dehydratase [Oligoflexia bacterium]|nr:GDP-mannose 4,6-dehydratase [Oligoflexia bacterium]